MLDMEGSRPIPPNFRPCLAGAGTASGGQGAIAEGESQSEGR